MDYIEIKDLQVYAYNGVFPEEKKLGQKFIISIKLFLSLQKSGLSDSLEDSVNYADVCEKINRIMLKSTFLIESAAEKIAQHLFSEYSMIKEIELTIKKPAAPVPQFFDYIGVTLKRKRHIAYIGLGSNMGDKKSYLDNAIKQIDDNEYCKVAAVSSYITTSPVGYTDQDDFLNAAAKIETTLEPEELLDVLQSAENNAGRKRTIHWGPRTLDLDILLYDNEIINTDRLTVPHPEMHRRSFVLVPLNEIAPYAYNPALKKYIKDMIKKEEHQ